MNEVKRLRTLNSRLDGHALIERRQLPLMGASQGQKITIGNVRRVEKTACVNVLIIQQRYVVRPEGMSGQS